MKTLLLVRHAKSSWDDINLSDFERPLNKRGINDAPLMAAVIKELGIIPDCILSSSANRAKTTAEIFARHFNLTNSNFKEDVGIYRGNYLDYIKFITNTENKCNTLFLFGHNPVIGNTATHLLTDFYEHIPTCGCICIDFDIDDWRLIESVKPIFRFFEYPSKYKIKK